jgi:protein-tyrosine phosphatase
MSERQQLRAVRILVVCTGNLCRSPLAAELLRIRLAKAGAITDVRSAGTGASNNESPPVAMIDAGLDVGADLAGHRSMPITAALIDGADLILGATIAHCRDVLGFSEGAANRTFTLVEAGHLAATVATSDPSETFDLVAWRREMASLRSPGRYWQRRTHAEDIADPYGGPVRRYEAVAREVAAAVDMFVSAWVQQETRVP